MIDIDHVLDYYLQRGVTLKIKKIYSWCIEGKFKFFFNFFHSLELIFLLWVTIPLFKLGVSWVVFAIGLTQHMILDMLFNKDQLYPYSYFLIFRVIKRFRKEDVCKDFNALSLKKE